MAQIEIEAEERQHDNAKRIREAGDIPAVLYGGSIETKSIQVSSDTWQRLAEEGGRRSVVQLQVEGEEDSHPVMIREVQRDPIHLNVLHVDFYQVDLDESVVTSVPIRMRGEEQATKTGGVVQYQVRELEIECLPGDIPNYIEIDVSELEVNDSLTVADIPVPEGVAVQDSAETVLVSVVLPQVELEPVTAEEDEEEEALLDEEGVEIPEDEEEAAEVEDDEADEQEG